MYQKCDFANNRRKYRNKPNWCSYKQTYCDGNGFIKPDFEPTILEPKDVCAKSSIFGNYYIKITDKDIEALKSGKAVAIVGEEYNIFIEYEV